MAKCPICGAPVDGKFCAYCGYQVQGGERPNQNQNQNRSQQGPYQYAQEPQSNPYGDTYQRGYGSVVFGGDGRLHAYVYYKDDESVIDHAVSEDRGDSWTVCDPCHVEKGARNPQTAYIDGVFIMHARNAGEDAFVFYTSKDGAVWDAGTEIAKTAPAGQYYSNNLQLSDKAGNFLLVQYSESYDGSKVNVKHLKLRIK